MESGCLHVSISYVVGRNARRRADRPAISGRELVVYMYIGCTCSAERLLMNGARSTYVLTIGTSKQGRHERGRVQWPSVRASWELLVQAQAQLSPTCSLVVSGPYLGLVFQILPCCTTEVQQSASFCSSYLSSAIRIVSCLEHKRDSHLRQHGHQESSQVRRDIPHRLTSHALMSFGVAVVLTELGISQAYMYTRPTCRYRQSEAVADSGSSLTTVQSKRVSCWSYCMPHLALYVHTVRWFNWSIRRKGTASGAKENGCCLALICSLRPSFVRYGTLPHCTVT